MRAPPAEGLSDKSPVTQVTPGEAEAFCALLDMQLPTSRQWEAIARSPNAQRRYSFPGSLSPDHIRKFKNQFDRGALPWNKTFEGVFDMSGSVREWVRCDDDRAYCLSKNSDGPRYGHHGGSSTSDPIWYAAALLGAPASGLEDYRCHRASDIGFRCVAPVEEASP